MPRICILNYGLGNIRSLHNALKYLGYFPEFYSDTKQKVFDVIFIPGVGSFEKGSNLINSHNIKKFLEGSVEKSLIFGICLGMQLFLTKGFEPNESNGLNFIKGEVRKINNKGRKNLILPAVGFQKINIEKKINFLNEFNNEKFYFVHSYAANLENKSNEIASSMYYNYRYTSVIENNRVFGTQFHPEKSGDVGLNLIANVIENL